MDTVLQDVRNALRSFRRRPAFSIVVVLTLAMAIGANTAIFSLINAVMLKPLPVRDAGELMIIGRGESCCMSTGVQRDFDLWSYRLYHDVLDHSKDYFSGFAAVSAQKTPIQVREAGSNGPARMVWARLVSANYFEVIGAEPQIGRGFVPTEDEPGGRAAVAVISDRYWTARYGRSSSAVGSSVMLNGLPFTIVGIAPRGFFGESLGIDPADIWAPLAMQPEITQARDAVHRPDVQWLYTFGRLRPGVTAEQVESWLKPQISQYMLANTEGMTERDRQTAVNVNVQLTPGKNGFSSFRRAFHDPLMLLMSMVALLLLICCANIANLMLSFATSRQKEMATRVALGARPARLVRQLLTESVTLGVIGGALGLLVGYVGTRAIVAMRFANANFVPLKIGPDFRVFAFDFAVAIATALLFGLAPAVKASRMDIMARIRGIADSPASGKLNAGKLLVVAQVAISLMLVAGATLLSRSLVALQTQEFGFDGNVIDINIDTSKAGYRYEQLESLYRTFRERVGSVPGVRSVSYAQYAPFTGNNWNSSITIPGTRNDGIQVARWTRVGPDFLSTVGIHLLAGRAIEERDNRDTTHVAVVTESFAKRFFPGEDAIGKHFSFEEDGSDPLEIVGIANDSKFLNPRETLMPTAYLPLFQEPISKKNVAMYRESAFVHDVMVRVEADPGAVKQGVQKVLHDINPDLPVRNVHTMRQNVEGSMLQDIVVRKLASVFGLIGLVVATLGVYGLLMYSVVRRTKELGIRFAVGATRRNVTGMILRESLRLIAIGIALGVPLTVVTTRFASSLLFGVKPYDPAALVVSALTLLLVAVIAGCIPAIRAARVDPIIVLRAE